MRQGDTSGTLVMVVDDHEDTRVMMRRQLELGGFRVVEAVDGREAVERAGSLRPAVILMDLNMPVLDGFTAALRIRECEETRGVPIVALTAYDTAESRAAARAVGCSEYFAKPIAFDELLSLVSRLAPGSRAGAPETEPA